MSSVQKRFIQEQHRSIRNRLDPDAITPYLRQQGLLTDDESDELLGSSLTRSGKIDLIVKSLPSKGKGWWNKFLQCLRESATKPGLPAHQELAELLENELVQLKEVSIGFLSSYYFTFISLTAKNLHTKNMCHFANIEKAT